MPLVGTRQLGALAADAPLLPNLDTEPWDLRGATTLQIIYEMEEGAMTSLLPPALHPTIPPTLVMSFTQVPDSPAGPFTLAEVRAGCRSGARPRAFLVRAYCDSEAAVRELRNRWGYPVRLATVVYRRGYDRVEAWVEAGGRRVLDCAMVNPEPIAGNDVQYLANMNLARIVRGGAEVVRLIQVDPDYVFSKADRGKPQLLTFDAEAFGLGGSVPSWPVSASATVADITLPHIRYIVDPEKPPLQSVEKL